jgi:centromeric protein E
MVGEDHSVSALIKDKDAEIAELRARLDDKDRMLAALRSAARSRDAAEGLETLRSEARASLLLESVSPPPQDALPDPPITKSNKRYSPVRKQSVDEMSRILDEMIQDRVESGHIVRGVRGSVQVVNDGKTAAPTEPSQSGLEPLRSDQPAGGDSISLVQEA